jgi:hypothetical protein
MTGLSSKSFDAPDEARTPDKTKVDVVRLSGATVARLTFQPGWRWSECVKPVAGTESCQARHIGAIVSGQTWSVTTEVKERLGPVMHT